jgi:hypothetical protein
LSFIIETSKVLLATTFCATAVEVTKKLAGATPVEVTKELVSSAAVEVTQELAGGILVKVTKDLAYDTSVKVMNDLVLGPTVEVTKEAAGGLIVKSTRDICTTAVSLGAIYTGYRLMRPLIAGAVKKAFGGERDDQDVRDIKPGSLHVLLCCFTDERFLEVLADYESGKIKERLQKEFSEIGIEVEGMTVEIENMKEVEETRAAIKKRYINQYGA